MMCTSYATVLGYALSHANHGPLSLNHLPCVVFPKIIIWSEAHKKRKKLFNCDLMTAAPHTMLPAVINSNFCETFTTPRLSPFNLRCPCLAWPTATYSITSTVMVNHYISCMQESGQSVAKVYDPDNFLFSHSTHLRRRVDIVQQQCQSCRQPMSHRHHHHHHQRQFSWLELRPNHLFMHEIAIIKIFFFFLLCSTPLFCCCCCAPLSCSLAAHFYDLALRLRKLSETWCGMCCAPPRNR